MGVIAWWLSTDPTALVDVVDLSGNPISGTTHSQHGEYKNTEYDTVEYDIDVTAIASFGAIKVKSLIIKNCDLGPKAITALAATLNTALVEWVDLTGNSIGSEGGKALVKVLP